MEAATHTNMEKIPEEQAPRSELSDKSAGLNALEARMLLMRQRFQRLEELEDDADILPGTVAGSDTEKAATKTTTEEQPIDHSATDGSTIMEQPVKSPLHSSGSKLGSKLTGKAQAANRWGKLRKVVTVVDAPGSPSSPSPSPVAAAAGRPPLLGSGGRAKSMSNIPTSPLKKTMPARSVRGLLPSTVVEQTDNDKTKQSQKGEEDNEEEDDKESTAALEQVSLQLTEFWNDATLPVPPVVNYQEVVHEFTPPEPPKYEEEFVDETVPKKLLISKVPEEAVRAQQVKLEQARIEERQRIADHLREQQSDLIWREHQARQRVMKLADDARERNETEKVKNWDELEEKEKKIGRDFRRAREGLEFSIRLQLATIRERFGEVITSGASLARRYGVQSVLTPQPVEVRIHLLRAVKTKLPKGIYVMMLTQYESLGGNPIAWSKVGVYGIGKSRAATTKPVKHYGRYFDRSMVFEDSCFALCPPRTMMKPSFVFVLELFHLASRMNPYDKVVAWTAIPMCNEHMAVVEGKFKLPLLRGEQNPSTEHFRTIERNIANDLNAWLCNAYIEVRKMKLSEVEDVDTNITKETDLEYDFINKKVRTEYGGSSGADGTAAGDRDFLWRSSSNLGRNHNNNIRRPPPRGLFETVKYNGGSLLNWLSGARGYQDGTAAAGGGSNGNDGYARLQNDDQYSIDLEAGHAHTDTGGVRAGATSPLHGPGSSPVKVTPSPRKTPRTMEPDGSRVHDEANGVISGSALVLPNSSTATTRDNHDPDHRPRHSGSEQQSAAAVGELILSELEVRTRPPSARESSSQDAAMMLRLSKERSRVSFRGDVNESRDAGQESDKEPSSAEEAEAAAGGGGGGKTARSSSFKKELSSSTAVGAAVAAVGVGGGKYSRAAPSTHNDSDGGNGDENNDDDDEDSTKGLLAADKELFRREQRRKHPPRGSSQKQQHNNNGSRRDNGGVIKRHARHHGDDDEKETAAAGTSSSKRKKIRSSKNKSSSPERADGGGGGSGNESSDLGTKTKLKRRRKPPTTNTNRSVADRLDVHRGSLFGNLLQSWGGYTTGGTKQGAIAAGNGDGDDGSGREDDDVAVLRSGRKGEGRQMFDASIAELESSSSSSNNSDGERGSGRGGAGSSSSSDEEEEDEEEVLERGYTSTDEFYLHEEQKGLLGGGADTAGNREARMWAAAGLEGKIVRRLHSDGSRFDSEAITSLAAERAAATVAAERALRLAAPDPATVSDNTDAPLPSALEAGFAYGPGGLPLNRAYSVEPTAAAAGRGLARNQSLIGQRLTQGANGLARNQSLIGQRLAQGAGAGGNSGGVDVSGKLRADGSRRFQPTTGYRGAGVDGVNGEGGNNPIASIDRWEPLEDPREMETYTMSLAADPSQRRSLLPENIFASKLRYLYLESFGDLMPYQWGTFKFYVTVLVMLFAIWIRIYVHFLAQYLYLASLKTPVFGFNPKVLMVSFKYMSASISEAQEVGVVAVGPLVCVLMFVLFALAGKLFYKFAGFLPDSCSKFIASFGIATIFDPILIAFIDLVYHNYSCESYDSNCSEDYTANTCPCYNGDFIKLWDHMAADEGSGMTGALITVMLYIGSMIVGTLLLYEYLVYVHKDARILDLWRRTKAPAEEFFLPNDYEMAHAELMSICHKAINWRGPSGASRKVMISTYIERDPFDPAFEATTKHYAVYECTLEGKKRLYRHFLLLPDGSIIEIFEQFTLNLGAQYHQLNRLLLDAEQATVTATTAAPKQGTGDDGRQDDGDGGHKLEAGVGDDAEHEDHDGFSADAAVVNPLLISQQSKKAANNRGGISTASVNDRRRSSGRRMSTELKQLLQHRKNRLFAGLEHA